MNLYQCELEKISRLNLPWGNFFGRTVMISGATGMIGKCLIDFFMLLNTMAQTPVKIIALSRSKEREIGRAHV